MAATKTLTKTLKDHVTNYLSQFKSGKTELARYLNFSLSSDRHIVFLSLCFLLILLPGNSYYLMLHPQPQSPLIRSIPLDLSQPTRYPIADPQIKAPDLSAVSAVVIDAKSASVLYEKNPDQELLPASTTKIMTALVAIKHYSLDQVVTVNRAHQAIGQTMGLIAGERITVENLLYGLLLESGNDAAFALAENIPGGYSAFVDAMNREADRLHMKNTQFKNVSGVEQPGHYTTVKDLARLSAEAMKNQVFSRIVSTQEFSITNVEQTIYHALVNKNQLLGNVSGVRGIKTGWTEQAGECLVTNTIRQGNEIVVVVLGSQDRFGESQELIEWAFRAHTWMKPGA